MDTNSGGFNLEIPDDNEEVKEYLKVLVKPKTGEQGKLFDDDVFFKVKFCGNFIL